MSAVEFIWKIKICEVIVIEKCRVLRPKLNSVPKKAVVNIEYDENYHSKIDAQQNDVGFCQMLANSTFQTVAIYN